MALPVAITSTSVMSPRIAAKSVRSYAAQQSGGVRPEISCAGRAASPSRTSSAAFACSAASWDASGPW